MNKAKVMTLIDNLMNRMEFTPKSKAWKLNGIITVEEATALRIISNHFRSNAPDLDWRNA